MAKQAGVRAEADTRWDKIGYKVREHSLRKVPLIPGCWRASAGRADDKPAAPGDYRADALSATLRSPVLSETAPPDL